VTSTHILVYLCLDYAEYDANRHLGLGIIHHGIRVLKMCVFDS